MVPELGFNVFTPDYLYATFFALIWFPHCFCTFLPSNKFCTRSRQQFAQNSNGYHDFICEVYITIVMKLVILHLSRSLGFYFYCMSLGFL